MGRSDPACYTSEMSDAGACVDTVIAALRRRDGEIALPADAEARLVRDLQRLVGRSTLCDVYLSLGGVRQRLADRGDAAPALEALDRVLDRFALQMRRCHYHLRSGDVWYGAWCLGPRGRRADRNELRPGVGLTWRRGTRRFIAKSRDRLALVEIPGGRASPERPIPADVQACARAGLPVVPHSTRLSLGSARGPNRIEIERLGHLAEAVRAPLVSDHIAFSEAGELVSPHFSPMPRNRAAVRSLVRNIRQAQSMLPVPIALENIAAPYAWPESTMSEADFIGEVIDASEALLLLDLSNVEVNARNFGWDAFEHLSRLPLERIAYVHLAGHRRVDGILFDTHDGPCTNEALALLDFVVKRVGPLPVLLEWDARFPEDDSIYDQELTRIRKVLDGAKERTKLLDPIGCRRREASSGGSLNDLAQGQRALLAALLAGAPAPEGFDADRIARVRQDMAAQTSTDTEAAEQDRVLLRDGLARRTALGVVEIDPPGSDRSPGV